ncbi:MAG TPA: hypothetical protein VIB00_07760 [Pyrinomonadaceae bacterium]
MRGNATHFDAKPGKEMLSALEQAGGENVYKWKIRLNNEREQGQVQLDIVSAFIRRNP